MVSFMPIKSTSLNLRNIGFIFFNREVLPMAVEKELKKIYFRRQSR
jgi:hypothetical protein